MKKGRIVSWILSASIVLSGVLVRAEENVFSDVSNNHWAYSEISEMSNRKVLLGYPNGKFYPENSVTRAEFAKIMTVASGVNVSMDVYNYNYTDVKTDNWFYPYVNAATPYLSGYETSSGRMFMPNSNALREDIAVALVKLKGYDVSLYDESALSTMFTDSYSISSGARPYIYVAVEKGLISGFDDDTFKGQETVTRAQAATLLYRAYQFGNDNKNFDVAVVPTATPSIAPSSTPSPTQTATASPTKSPTASPTVTPTPTPVATETPTPKKPYVIDTVKNVKVDYVTYDDNDNAYYISNGILYKMNLNNGSAEKLLSIDRLTYKTYKTEEKQVTKQVEKTVYKDVEVPIDSTLDEIEPADGDEDEITDDENQQSDEEAPKTKIIQVPETVTEDVVETVSEKVLDSEYKEYATTDLFYDTNQSRLFLIGKFTKRANQYSLNDYSETNYANFLVSDDGAEYFSDVNCSYYGKIRGCVDKDQYIISGSDYNTKILDLSSGKYDVVNNHWKRLYLTAKNGSEILGMLENEISRMNFMNKSWDTVGDEFEKYPKSFDVSDGNFYYWADNLIVKVSFTGKQTKFIDIDETDIIDLKTMDKISQRMHVTNKGNVIFYDTNSLAFRVIKKS